MNGKWRKGYIRMWQGDIVSISQRWLLKLQQCGLPETEDSQKWLSQAESVLPLNAIEEKRSAQF